MKKTLLTTAIASTLVIGVSIEAADFKVSGQVSRVIVSPDDDAGDELQFLDNNISGSRIRFEGNRAISEGWKGGFRLEAQLQSNKGSNADGGLRTDTGGNLSGDDSIDLRFQDIYVVSPLGIISLGKGDGAGNGTTETDLSGTYIIAPANSVDLYGGFIIDDANNAPDVRVFNVYGEVDAYSRVNRLRYDSNNFNGLSFAASYGQQEVSELAVRFAGGTDMKYKVQGFIGSRGESSEGRGDKDDRWGISGSVLLSNGLNFTLSRSEEDQDLDTDEDRENTWFKLGYKTGKHAFSVDYGETEDTDEGASTKTEAETMGASYVFAPAKGMEFFVGYREYSLDDTTGTDPELFTVGSRIKF